MTQKEYQQDAINRNWKYFITDKNPHNHDGLACQYEDGDGKRCAVGLLIESKEVRRRFDFWTGQIVHLLRKHPEYPFLVSLVGQYGPRFLDDLQQSHDKCAIRDIEGIQDFHEAYRAALFSICSTYGLTIPE